MIVGFNHNILYKGVGFHVQTEDSGLKSPSLVTLLYRGGIIVSSQKTSYADILDVENLSHVVEELAKEQHKGMLRRLTKGEFDQRICELGIEIESSQSAQTDENSPADKPADIENDQVLDFANGEEPLAADEVEGIDDSFVEAAAVAGLPESIEPAYEPQSAEERNTQQDISGALDDLIFSYLTGVDEKH